MAGKNACKNAVSLEKKRSDIFFSLGYMHSSLAKCRFFNASKIGKDFEKTKWHVKMHEKMPFH